MSKNKEYANAPRDTDKSLMDVLSEIGTAVMEGFRGSQRASQNPASEGSRARNRMEQRQGKAYGGKAKKMAKGGKLPMVEKDGKKVPFYAADGKGKMAYGGRTKMMYGGKAHGKKK